MALVARLLALLALVVLMAGTTPMDGAPRRVARMYDLAPDAWGPHLQQERDYYASTFKNVRFEYIDLGPPAEYTIAACDAVVLPSPGIRFCYSPEITRIAGSSTGGRWKKNASNVWELSSRIMFFSGGENPGPDSGAARIIPCHEMGHVLASLPHQGGFYESCMNSVRWRWDFLSPEEIVTVRKAIKARTTG